jgi:hypothetical protein
MKIMLPFFGLLMTIFPGGNFAPGKDSIPPRDSGYDDLPITKVQIIGSHNSYKQALDPALFSYLKAKNPQAARAIEYTQASLEEQLNLGLRNLEIDVYADEKGGKYAHPKGLEWEAASNPPPYDPNGEMNKPGFKVFHIQDLDFRTWCYTFADCLKQLKAWSDAHPDHYPIYITMNTKDDEIKFPGFTVPEKFTAEVMDRLDKEILDHLGRDKVITPDDIRGKSATLESAILEGGHWPTMRQAKGKFFFIMDEPEEHRNAYIKGHPSLKGRVLFVDAPTGTPEAGFIVVNDPLRPGIADSIPVWTKKGYMVRTKADSDTEEARRNDRKRFILACNSGAQVISTDYYYKSTFFESDYSVQFEDGKYIRKLP